MPRATSLLLAIFASLALLASATPSHAQAADEPQTPPSASSRQQIRVAKLFGWQPLDDQNLLLWTGKEEVWQLSLSYGCEGLKRARAISVTTDRRHIKIGKDRVQLDDKRCTILALTLPDEKLKKRYSKARKGYVAELLPWPDTPEMPVPPPAANGSA